MLDELLDARRRVEELLPQVNEHLGNLMRTAEALPAAALVREVYRGLLGAREVPWANRAHFFGAAAEVVRRRLVESARAGEARVCEQLVSMDPGDVLRFDDALRRLEIDIADAAQVVRLRVLAGLDSAETSEAMGVSPSTVERLWGWARAWLARQGVSVRD